MQSNEEYQDAVIVVCPSEKHGGEATDYYFQDESLPVDGFVEIRYPKEETHLEDGTLYDGWEARWGRYWRHTIPYRDESKDGPWFAHPEADKWHRSPIWKWTNAPDTENITLSPSYGMRDSDAENGWMIHCWIRNGEIDLL